MESVLLGTRNMNIVCDKDHESLNTHKPRVSREDIESYLGSINPIARTIVDVREDELVKGLEGFHELPADVQDHITDGHFMNPPTRLGKTPRGDSSTNTDSNVCRPRKESNSEIETTNNVGSAVVVPDTSSLICTARGARARQSLRLAARRVACAPTSPGDVSAFVREKTCSPLKNDVSSAENAICMNAEEQETFRPNANNLPVQDCQVHVAALQLQRLLLKTSSLDKNSPQNDGASVESQNRQTENSDEKPCSIDSIRRGSRLRMSRFRSRRSSTGSNGQAGTSISASHGSTRGRRRRTQGSVKQKPKDGTCISLPLERGIPDPISFTPAESQRRMRCAQPILGSENITELNSIVAIKSPTKSIGSYSAGPIQTSPRCRLSLVDTYPENCTPNRDTAA
eukprot:m.1588688 g.1588688  ORF g.1588688 m.1588688 type:complete len:399 (-) comp25331_c2_seq47:1593-2789(-)